jgi:hypothetical protein
MSSVTARLRPIVEALPEPARLPFIAALERGAASRYRGWAAEVAEPEVAAGLRACAEREEEIARRVEALAGRSAAELSGLEAAWSGVREVAVAAFGGRPLAAQLAIQAAAERGGAEIWRELAAQPGAAPEARAVLLACAALEEESAAFVEGALRGGRVAGATAP